jgi:biopolymer transport protein ExbB
MTVAAREEALGRTELLAAGIYQALVTTAVGLCIAIPAMVLYHVFVEKVDRMVAQMDDIANELVEKITAAV